MQTGGSQWAVYPRGRIAEQYYVMPPPYVEVNEEARHIGGKQLGCRLRRQRRRRLDLRRLPLRRFFHGEAVVHHRYKVSLAKLLH